MRGLFPAARMMMKATSKATEFKRVPKELNWASHFVGMEEIIDWATMIAQVRRKMCQLAAW